MKISIIVPVYNAEKYLERCIKSIISQTHIDIELILVNDGSTDKSKEICYFYKDKDSRIIVIDKKNEGPSLARNSALEIATGDYIGFVDADDFLNKNMYEILIKEAEKSNSDIVCCGFEFVKNNDVNKKNIMFESIKNFSLPSDQEIVYELFINSKVGIFNVWNKIYKTDMIKNNNIFFPVHLSSAEDCEFNLKVIKHVKVYTFLPETLYYYFIGNNSLTRGYIKDSLKKHFDWRTMIQNYIPSKVINKENNKMTINAMTIKYIIFFLNQEIWFNSKGNFKSVFLNTIQLNEVKEVINNTEISNIDSKLDRTFYYLIKNNNYITYRKFSLLIKILKLLKNITK